MLLGLRKYLLMSIQNGQWSIASDQLHWHVLAELPGHLNNRSLWRSCRGAGPVCRHVCADPECCLQSAVCADSEIPAGRTCVCATEPGYRGETKSKSMSQSLLPYEMIKIGLPSSGPPAASVSPSALRLATAHPVCSKWSTLALNSWCINDTWFANVPGLKIHKHK